MKLLYYFFTLAFLLYFPLTIFATSGACSSHGGVDCSKGRQLSDKVYCMDGWTDSATYFDYTKKCDYNEFESCPFYLNQSNYDYFKDKIESEIKKIENNTEKLCENLFNTLEKYNEKEYQICLNYNHQQEVIALTSGRARYAPNLINLKDCEPEKDKRTEINKNKEKTCLYGDDELIYKYKRKLICMKVDKTVSSPKKTEPLISK